MKRNFLETADSTDANILDTKCTINGVVHPYIKAGVIMGRNMNINVLVDTGTHYSLINDSVARKLGLYIEETERSLYGIGSITVPTTTAQDMASAKITVDGVEAGPVTLLIVPDEAQRTDLLVGKAWLDLPYVQEWKQFYLFIYLLKVLL